MSEVVYAPISVQYMDHMGSDLTVVNAARASFDKESEWVWDDIERPLNSLPAGSWYNAQGHKQVLKKSDVGLIRFLESGYRTSEWEDLLAQIKNAALSNDDAALTKLMRAYKKKAQHWAPFAHPSIQMRVTMPVFIAKQLVKHSVGCAWSEASRRYLDDKWEFYKPDTWHSRPDDIKQGSGEPVRDADWAAKNHDAITEYALRNYESMRGLGVAPEEARMDMPLSHMTTVVWTGSLLFWARVCNQRLDDHAQLAAQEVAKKISDIVQPLFPESWRVLVQE